MGLVELKQALVNSKILAQKQAEELDARKCYWENDNLSPAEFLLQNKDHEQFLRQKGQKTQLGSEQVFDPCKEFLKSILQLFTIKYSHFTYRCVLLLWCCRFWDKLVLLPMLPHLLILMFILFPTCLKERAQNINSPYQLPQISFNPGSENLMVQQVNGSSQVGRAYEERKGRQQWVSCVLKRTNRSENICLT